MKLPTPLLILVAFRLASPAEWIGEFGTRFGWRHYEEKMDGSKSRTGEYLLRPGLSAGLAARFGSGWTIQPEIGIFYKTVKEMRAYDSGPISDSSGLTSKKGENGFKQTSITLPVSVAYYNHKWLVRPFVCLEAAYFLSTTEPYDIQFTYISSDRDRREKGNEDWTWAYKKMNLYLSPGFEIPFRGAFKNLSMKTSLDVAVFDAPKADTVAIGSNGNYTTRYIFTNRFSMHAMSFSLRYVLF